VVWAACRQDNLSNSVFSQNPVAPGMSGTGSTGMTQTSVTIHDCSGSGCAPVNTTTYFHGDQIGSARLLSAGYGYPVWQGTFTPFGQEVSPEITSNHYKFNGKERGEATEGSLDYFGARYYSSVIGRWMTPDWSGEPSPIPYATLTNPQSLNLYSFVTDDPLSHTDLDGYFQMAPASGPCPNNNGDTCGAMSSAYKCSVRMTTFCQQAADEAVEAAQRDKRGINFSGSKDGKSYVRRDISYWAVDKDGNKISAGVSLQVVIYFSEKEGEEGKFLGAELIIQTVSPDENAKHPLSGAEPTTTSVPITLWSGSTRDGRQ
jgi:RHS repeat-associated protein